MATDGGPDMPTTWPYSVMPQLIASFRDTIEKEREAKHKIVELEHQIQALGRELQAARILLGALLKEGEGYLLISRAAIDDVNPKAQLMVSESEEGVRLRYMPPETVS